MVLKYTDVSGKWYIKMEHDYNIRHTPGRRASKAVGDRLLKPCYLSRVDQNRRIRTRKQRTDVGKYSFVNFYYYYSIGFHNPLAGF
jgi:hypothetical protein